MYAGDLFSDIYVIYTQPTVFFATCKVILLHEGTNLRLSANIYLDNHSASCYSS